MNEELNTAIRDLGLVSDALRKTLNKSNAVQSIIVLDLIKQTNETRNKVVEFLGAIESDDKTKVFFATWGNGYTNPMSKEITMDEINDENGWLDDNIEKINNAKVGDVVDCSDMIGTLIVKRIK